VVAPAKRSRNTYKCQIYKRAETSEAPEVAVFNWNQNTVLKVVCLGYKHVRLQYTDVTVPTYCVQKIVLKLPVTQHCDGMKIPNICMSAKINKINADILVISYAQKQNSRGQAKNCKQRDIIVNTCA